MKNNKKPYLLALFLVAVVLAFWQATPRYLISKAHGILVLHGCTDSLSGAQLAAPGEPFYDAMDLLETAGGFPGFADEATQVSTDAALRCLACYKLACMEMAYWAQDTARAHAQEAHDVQMESARTSEERRAVDENFDATCDAFDKKDPRWLAKWLPDDERQRFCLEWKRFSDWLSVQDAPAGCLVCSF